MTVTRAAQNHSGGAAIPARSSSLGRLGSWSYQHRRLVAAAWLVILVLATLAGRSAGQQFKDNLNDGSATQSQQAASFLQGHFPSQAGDVAQVVFQTRARGCRTGAVARLARLAGRLSRPG